MVLIASRVAVRGEQRCGGSPIMSISVHFCASLRLSSSPPFRELEAMPLFLCIVFLSLKIYVCNFNDIFIDRPFFLVYSVCGEARCFWWTEKVRAGESRLERRE